MRAACGQDEDRRGAAGGAPAFQDRQAVDVRQTEIKNDQVIRFGVAFESSVFTVGGEVAGKAGIAQGGANVIGDAGFVFDYEDAHQSSSSILMISPVVAS